MRARLVVMGNPLFQQAAEVPLAKRNDEVEKLSAHRANEPFAVRIRFWGSHWGFQNLQPERLKSRIEVLREDRIAVVDQELLSVVAGKGFPKLLQRPGGSRMGRDIAVHNPPRANFH